MVDINLFKDEEEEEEKEEGKGGEKSNDSSQNDQEGLGGGLDDELDFNDEDALGGDLEEDQDADFNLDDELGDDLNENSDSDIEDDLDKEFGDDDSLDDEEFLDDELSDEEAIPEFSEQKKGIDGKDYSFGEVKKKGVSPFLLILLGILIIVVSGYFFVYKPKVDEIRKMQSKKPKVPDVEELIEQQKKEMAESKDSTSTAAVDSQDTVKKPSQAKPGVQNRKVDETVSSIKPTALAQNTGSLIEYFSQKNCLGTIIIDIKNKYLRAGYASLKSKTGDEIAARIQEIFNIDEYELSPEDRDKIEGTIRYWGMISGELTGTLYDKRGGKKSFTTTRSLNQWLEQTANNFSLTVKESKIYPATSESGKTIVPLQIKVEGINKNLINYLTILMQNSGNYHVDKMIITPVNLTDFKGEKLKFVIDLRFIS